MRVPVLKDEHFCYTPRPTEIFPNHRDHLALRRSLGWRGRLRVDVQCHLA
jgi:hypothetical protein